MQWVIGTTLQDGKYVIEEELGQGGFGTTYKARHTEINYHVAIKTPNAFLKHDPDYEKYLNSFTKEAKRIAMTAREPHPHLVRFTDYFLEGDRPCLVMEFVDGTTLFELVRQRGALPEVEVVTLLQEIGGALQWMHDKNLVHRDVSPANIMISREGRSVLIDLGIAQEISPTTRTSTKAAGHSGFAPYEQLMDGVRDVRCDVYSLAATAYFAITGVRPPGSFQRKIEGESLQEPATRVALSGELNRAIVEGMALELEERPEDIARWVARVEPQPSPSVTVEPQPQPKEQTATPPSSTPPVEATAPKQKATISNANFAIASVLFFLWFVAFAVLLGMVNNLWAVACWAVAVAVAVALPVAVPVAVALPVAVAVTLPVAVAVVVAWGVAVTVPVPVPVVVAWGVALAVTAVVGGVIPISWAAVDGSEDGVRVAFGAVGGLIGTVASGLDLSVAGGLLVGGSLWFGGLLVMLWLNSERQDGLYTLIASVASGVMASVLVDRELAVMAASTAGAITGSFTLAIVIVAALSNRGYSEQQAAFMVSVLVTFGLSIGWLLGRFVFS